MNDEVENSKQQKKILLEYKNPSRVAFLSYEPFGWEKSSDPSRPLIRRESHL